MPPAIKLRLLRLYRTGSSGGGSVGVLRGSLAIAARTSGLGEGVGALEGGASLGAGASVTAEGGGGLTHSAASQISSPAQSTSLVHSARAAPA